MDEPSFQSPDFYINRELSWLEFNRRVMELSTDPQIPLLERLKFLCISSSNLDEFFEVRIARLKEHIRYQANVVGPDGIAPTELFKRISAFTHRFVTEQYRVLAEDLFPALEAKGICFVRRGNWTENQTEWITNYFNEEVLPVLSPLGIDPSHPFPKVLNKSLNFIVSLQGKDAFDRESTIAIVQAPRSLTRIVQFPPEITSSEYDFVFLSSIIHANVHRLFPGMTVKGCFQFRATRNSDLFVDEEEIEDLRGAIEEELFSRNYGNAVRLEVADNCPPEITQFLLEQFVLQPEDCYQVSGLVNVNRLMAIPSAIDRPDLKFAPFTPGVSQDLTRRSSMIFDAIRDRDILLHHPYESFVSVVDFFRQAANDPQVLAIKLTLYRTDLDSSLPASLIQAARNGKEVTAVIELRARFDEARNIKLAHQLEDAGAHVTYGVVGYKIHAKMGLVVRREGNKIQRYCHLGTGNYHAKTARLYTDIGLMTANPLVTEDVHSMFLQLTGLGQPLPLHKLYQAPFTLQKGVIELIDREAENARNGIEGRIIAKMNSITEPQVIQALYRASTAGVQIDLIVRGICCLRPGIPGVSENIRVRSIVGRFLEHSRAAFFANAGDPIVTFASADWMNRNLFRRVEQMAPVDNPELKQRLIREVFDVYLKDTTNTWELQSDGSYKRISPEGQESINAQQILSARYDARIQFN